MAPHVYSVTLLLCSSIHTHTHTRLHASRMPRHPMMNGRNGGERRAESGMDDRKMACGVRPKVPLSVGNGCAQESGTGKAGGRADKRGAPRRSREGASDEKRSGS